MKLIIDIDEKKYEEIKRIAKAQFELTDKTEAQIIANGIPYESKGDLISREALKKAIENYLAKRQDVIIWETDMFNMLDNAPTVDLWQLRQEATENALKKTEVLYGRPKGEWVAHEDMDEWYECNKCYCGNTYFDKLPNFCPNCGADMQKGGAE